MKKILSGPGNTGKTKTLSEKYQKRARQTGTEKCLVFVKNAAGVSSWEERLNLKIMGPLEIYTFLGFVQQEVSSFWPDLQQEVKSDSGMAEPIFMNVETAHYIMTCFVEKRRNSTGVLDNVGARTPRIAVQLIDNLNQGALNGLSLKEIEQRLFYWAGEDREKKEVFREAFNIMNIFRSFCQRNGVLDYSLGVELFNRCLLQNEDYIRRLTDRYNYLFVDDLEKTVPVAQDLFLKIIGKVRDSFFAFNEEAGFNRFFGGNPERARNKFFPQCQIENKEKQFISSPEARSLAEAISEAVRENSSVPGHEFIKGILESEYRGEMLEKTVYKVITMLEKEEVKPADIAIIMPEVDNIAEFIFRYFLENEGYSLNNLTDSHRLVDVPFTQALITLILLINRDWNQEITFSSLKQTLVLLLDLDPLQSSLLAQKICSANYKFPSPEDINISLDLQEYCHLKKWVQDRRKQKQDLQLLFQSIFQELLIYLSPSSREIKACRRFIDSLEKFNKVVTKFSGADFKKLGSHFINMLQNGTLAAEVLYHSSDRGEEAQGIILATPYKFLFSDIREVKYIFWLDISSQKWQQGLSKELSNPYIFTPNWKGRWDDEIDQYLRHNKLLGYLQNILSRCSSGLYLGDSYLDSRGWEQEGGLYSWLNPRQAGGENND